MSIQEQLATIGRYADEIWSQGNIEAIEEMFTADFVRHGPDIEQGPIQGVEGMKQLVMMYRTVFPDLTVPLEAHADENGMVFTYFTYSGTHQGAFLGVEPTGQSMNGFGFWRHRFAGSQIAEEWAMYDALGILTQAGIMQMPQ